MKKFYFYGAVTYPTKDVNEIPKGSIGIHSIEAENEEIAKQECEEKYNKYQIYLVDMFEKETKLKFKWYGELK